MSGLVNAFAWAVLASGLIGGLIALYSYVSAAWVILSVLAVIAAVVLVAVAAVYVTGRRHRDSYDYDDAIDKTIEAHMGPLRQPGDAEQTLMLDLRQRRMLLPGTRGQRGRHAAGAPQLPAIPPSAEARTESIPVVQEPTEVIPAVEPDTLFEDWHTGEFERTVWLLGVLERGRES